MKALEYAPNPDTHPHTFAWWSIASRYAPAAMNSWPAAPTGTIAPKGAAKPQKAASQPKKDAKPKKEVKKADKKEAEGSDSDPNFDPFASADEDGEEAKKSLKEAASKSTKAKKPPPIAKSLVILEVKPWGPETDLDKLGKKICEEIVMDGLVWKTEFKKEPIAYGVHKIVIGCVVEDEKVSVDDL